MASQLQYISIYQLVIDQDAKHLFTLGLKNDLKLIARDDELGRKLQDARLPIKARAPKANLKKSC